MARIQVLVCDACQVHAYEGSRCLEPWQLAVDEEGQPIDICERCQDEIERRRASGREWRVKALQ